LSFYEPAHLSVADTLNPTQLWKIQERFGDYANRLVAASQHCVTTLSEAMNLSLDGWVQDAGRSVVASAQGGEVIIKSPLVDGWNTVAAIAAYAETGAGPETRSVSIGASLNGTTSPCAVAMERVDGRYLHPSETPTVDELVKIITLAGQMDFTNLPMQPKFITLTERLEIEIIEAIRRAKVLGDTSSVAELSLLAAKISRTHRPARTCHGDLDMRNVLHRNGDIKIIDPEPLVAPVEFDAAKIAYSTGINPSAVAEQLGIDVQLTSDVHQFLTVSGRLYQRVKGGQLS
jgi:hypothetical protein